MTERLCALALTALLCTAQACRADAPLTQTTISVYADGKPVGGLIFPIGTTIDVGAIAVHTDRVGDNARYTGNVQSRFTPPAGQPIILFGEDVAVNVEPVSAERLRAVHDLEAMASSDQLYRGRSGMTRLTPAEWKLQTAIDTANMKRLAGIIEVDGWPSLHFAGAASRTAFLVLQHADHASQKKYLPLMRDAVRRSDALAVDLALLEDRVRMDDGQKQIYGSQLSGDPLRFYPIEDEAHVDERRRSIGLEPLTEYAKSFGLRYVAGE